MVPSLMTSHLYEKVPKKFAGKPPQGDPLENLPREKNDRLDTLSESLNLEGIETWEEQQQQSARDLIMEYQHLFVMNLSELGKTSLVQHDIKLDDMTPFKEQY